MARAAKKAKGKKAKPRVSRAKPKPKPRPKPKPKPKPTPKPSPRTAKKPAPRAAVDVGALIKILNEDRAFELAASMQYMGHHYEAEGLAAPEVMAEFKKAAIDEMKHCEELAERIVFLGGVPVYAPAKGMIRRGGDIKNMVRDDLEVEQEAIRRYKAHIKIAQAADDSTTRLILEKILAEEEEHANTWQTLLA